MFATEATSELKDPHLNDEVKGNQVFCQNECIPNAKIVDMSNLKKKKRPVKVRHRWIPSLSAKMSAQIRVFPEGFRMWVAQVAYKGYQGDHACPAIDELK